MRLRPVVPLLLAPLLLGLAAGCAPPKLPVTVTPRPVAQPAGGGGGFSAAPLPSDAATDFAARRAANLAPAQDSAVTQMNTGDRGDVDLQLPPMPTGPSPAFRAN